MIGMAGRHRAPRPPRQRRGRHRAQRPRAQRGVASLAAVAVLSGIGAGSAWWALQGHSHAQLPPVRHSALLEAITGPRTDPSTSPAVHQKQSPNRAQRRAASHSPRTTTLVVRTLGATSWVQVDTRAGVTLVARDVPPHQRLAFHRHGLHVTLGNAGAVALRVGGRTIDPAGSSGAVRHLTVR